MPGAGGVQFVGIVAELWDPAVPPGEAVNQCLVVVWLGRPVGQSSHSLGHSLGDRLRVYAGVGIDRQAEQNLHENYWFKETLIFIFGGIIMKPILIFMVLIACPAMVLGQGSGSDRPRWARQNQGCPAVRRVNRRCRLRSPRSTAEAITAMSRRRPPREPPCKARRRSSVPRTIQPGQFRGGHQHDPGREQRDEKPDSRRADLLEMRELGRAVRERERGPRPTPEELARRACAAAPLPLSPSQMDPVSGVLFWPAAFQEAVSKANASPWTGTRPGGRNTAGWSMPTRRRSARTLTPCSTC